MSSSLYNMLRWCSQQRTLQCVIQTRDVNLNPPYCSSVCLAPGRPWSTWPLFFYRAFRASPKLPGCGSLLSRVRTPSLVLEVPLFEQRKLERYLWTLSEISELATVCIVLSMSMISLLFVVHHGSSRLQFQTSSCIRVLPSSHMCSSPIHEYLKFMLLKERWWRGYTVKECHGMNPAILSSIDSIDPSNVHLVASFSSFVAKLTRTCGCRAMVKVNQMAVLQVATITLVVLGSLVQVAKAVNAWDVTTWTPSHATFYGDDSGAATMGTPLSETDQVITFCSFQLEWGE